MAKMYAGKVPNTEEAWSRIKTVVDPSDKSKWMVFSKSQAHTPDWMTYKVVADGRAEGKANYWFVRNSATGQLGFAKDLAIMRETRPALHSQIESFFKSVSA